MSERAKAAERAWLRAQVADYRRVRDKYAEFAEKLEAILRAEVAGLAPLAIVQARPKSIASFAEKAIRKRSEYEDPVREFTDLCGARVIARTRSEVNALSKFVKERFEIDEANSVDTADRLDPSAFGYRSAHYIVSFKPGVRYRGVSVPRRLHGLRAEVQLRTLLEHAWSDFAHDLSYKGAFELPAKWQRALAVIAAELEDVDHAFERFEEGLRVYASTYGAYMSQDEIPGEIETLEMVRAADRSDAGLAWRVAKLAMTLEDWEKAVAVLSAHVDAQDPHSAQQPILRDLGVSLCKVHGDSPTGRGYRRGQRYLELAIEAFPEDADALSSYAGTWRRLKGKKAQARARDYYRLGFEADPTHYYSLGNFLEYEFRRTKDASILPALEPIIRDAIERCRAQAEVGMNLPWAYTGMGKLSLLLGRPYDGLRAYAKAVQVSTAAFMVDGSIGSLERLGVVRDELRGYEWIRRMLVIGSEARFPSRKARRRVRALASEGCEPIHAPVVIVVGGTGPHIERNMRMFRKLLLDAFRDFQGTVISGGTEQGVSGLVGEVCAKYRRVRAVGYVPRGDPPSPHATVDRRYDEIRRTDGRGFSPIEPLQGWIDLLASRIKPSDVKILGIDGGEIAAVEYRIALALGASVGVLEETGREAARLLADKDWAQSETLVPLPTDPETVRAFIGSGSPKLDPTDRETIAMAIHEASRVETAAAIPRWGELDGALQESNCLQADYIFETLRQIRCDVRPVSDREIVRMSFTDDEVETMAAMEHGRSNAQRLMDGWRLGEREDAAAKISPDLVAWDQLREDARARNRAAVRKLPEYLAEVGQEVYRR